MIIHNCLRSLGVPSYVTAELPWSSASPATGQTSAARRYPTSSRTACLPMRRWPSESAGRFRPHMELAQLFFGPVEKVPGLILAKVRDIISGYPFHNMNVTTAKSTPCSSSCMGWDVPSWVLSSKLCLLFGSLFKHSRICSQDVTPGSSVVNKSISFMLPDFHIAQQFMFDLIAFGMPSSP